MKKWLVLLLAVALSGCTGGDATNEPEAEPAQEDTQEAVVDTNETVVEKNETVDPEPVANETAPPVANETIEPGLNETAEPGNETEEPREEVVLAEQHFEGTAPAAVAGEGALFIEHQFEVTGEVTSVRVLQVSEYIGLVSAVLYVTDATGADRAVATDDCGWTIMPGVLETFTCDVTITDDLNQGMWTARLVWQVGEVAETYTIDTTVMGYESA